MALSASLQEFQNLSAQQWIDRAQRSLPQIVSVVLVIAIAWQLAQLTWLLLDRSSESPAIAVVPTPPPMSAPRKGVDIQSIVNAHLFGTAQAEQPSVADAQPTQMNLVLSAVFATNDPAKGLAIIGESAQGAKVYTVGATVRPGTRLHAVYADKVILERGASLETLALPKQSTAGIQINRVPTAARNTQFADNLRRIAETNPGAFSEIVRAQPVFAGGVQRGVRVYPGRNRQQFAKLGLMPGDLVLSINGTPLDDPQRSMDIFNTIATSDRVSVTVERNGQPQELTLNTAQISLPDASPTLAPSRAPRGSPPAFTPTPPAE